MRSLAAVPFIFWAPALAWNLPATRRIPTLRSKKKNLSAVPTEKASPEIFQKANFYEVFIYILDLFIVVMLMAAC